MTLEQWFATVNVFDDHHSLADLRAGIKAGFLDEQDEYGMTALTLCVMCGWDEGAQELLRAGANTELRYFRTGDTPLRMAVLEKNEAMIAALLDAGANPDAANYWGVTPRSRNPARFEKIPQRPIDMPKPRIQNAEHLADHHHPQFKIPKLKERTSLQPGQAVDLYVYGPRIEGKQDTVKVRITERSDEGDGIRYTGTVETPIEQTHLPPGTQRLHFGPEHVACVYTPRPTKKKPRK